MRTTVIPAQVTTVEDKIAGNLNLTQIMLLLAPVLINTGIYVILPEAMHFSIFKIILISIIFIVFILLSLRIKDRVLLNWVAILAAYFLRPHLYVFNKNSSYLRDIPVESKQKKSRKIEILKKVQTEKEEPNKQQIDYAGVSRNTDITIRFGSKKVVAIKNI